MSVPYLGGSVIPGTTFRDAAGAPTDPTGISLEVLKPSGASTTYTYGVGGEIARDGVGVYHALVVLDEAGEWHYTWRGTGAVIIVDQNSIVVRLPNTEA